MNILMLASDYRTLQQWASDWAEMNRARVERHELSSMRTTLKSGDTISWVHAGDVDRIRGEVYDLVFTNERCSSYEASRMFAEAVCVAHTRLR